MNEKKLCWQKYFMQKYDLLQLDFLKSDASMQIPFHLEGISPSPSSLKDRDSGQIPNPHHIHISNFLQSQPIPQFSETKNYSSIVYFETPQSERTFSLTLCDEYDEDSRTHDSYWNVKERESERKNNGGNYRCR